MSEPRPNHGACEVCGSMENAPMGCRTLEPGGHVHVLCPPCDEYLTECFLGDGPWLRRHLPRCPDEVTDADRVLVAMRGATP